VQPDAVVIALDELYPRQHTHPLDRLTALQRHH
jgi:hypothetical protein